MKDCYLRFEKEFWSSRGRKTIYPAGAKLTYEVETMTSVVGDEIRRYYVYGKLKVHNGIYEQDEFDELFMTIDEFRDKKLDSLL